MSEKNLMLRILSDATVLSTRENSAERSVLPSMSPPTVVASVTGISPASLSAQLNKFMKALEEIVNSLPDTCGQYEVEELTFALSIDGSGSVSLVGQLSSGVR